MAQALRDPGNLGTMLRTGDAVGAGGLILIDDCADPFSVEAVRASMGAVFTQTIAQARWEEFLPWLRGGAGQLVAASLRDAVPYRGAAYAAPCFLLVGNESRGLPEAYEAECDLHVKMPMKGAADSLNAAVAAAVLAYEVDAALRPEGKQGALVRVAAGGDCGVAAGPVGHQRHHAPLGECSLYGLAAEGATFVDLAGDAPIRREVDKDGFVLGAQRRHACRAPRFAVRIGSSLLGRCLTSLEEG